MTRFGLRHSHALLNPAPLSSSSPISSRGWICHCLTKRTQTLWRLNIFLSPSCHFLNWLHLDWGTGFIYLFLFAMLDLVELMCEKGLERIWDGLKCDRWGFNVCNLERCLFMPSLALWMMGLDICQGGHSHFQYFELHWSYRKTTAITWKTSVSKCKKGDKLLLQICVVDNGNWFKTSNVKLWLTWTFPCSVNYNKWSIILNIKEYFT